MFDLFGMSIKVPAEEAQRFSVRRAYRCIYIYIYSHFVFNCVVYQYVFVVAMHVFQVVKTKVSETF